MHMQLPTEAQAEKELAEYERQQNRDKGHELAKIRDEGYSRVGTSRVSLVWYVDTPLKDGEARAFTPPGMFRIRVGNEEALLDKEEFLKVFRWVR